MTALAIGRVHKSHSPAQREARLPGHGMLGLGQKETLPVESLGPASLLVIAETEIQRQLVARPEIVLEVEGAVRSLLREKRRCVGHARSRISEHKRCEPKTS